MTPIWFPITLKPFSQCISYNKDTLLRNHMTAFQIREEYDTALPRNPHKPFTLLPSSYAWPLDRKIPLRNRCCWVVMSVEIWRWNFHDIDTFEGRPTVGRTVPSFGSSDVSSWLDSVVQLWQDIKGVTQSSSHHFLSGGTQFWFVPLLTKFSWWRCVYQDSPLWSTHFSLITNKSFVQSFFETM